MMGILTLAIIVIRPLITEICEICRICTSHAQYPVPSLSKLCHGQVPIYHST